MIFYVDENEDDSSSSSFHLFTARLVEKRVKKYSKNDKNRFYLICTNGQSLKDIKEWLFVYLHRTIALTCCSYFGGMPYVRYWWILLIIIFVRRLLLTLFHRQGEPRAFCKAKSFSCCNRNKYQSTKKPERIFFLRFRLENDEEKKMWRRFKGSLLLWY